MTTPTSTWQGRIAGAYGRLAGALFWIAGIVVVIMAMHIFANAASRWLLGRELPGTLEITRYYYMVILIFLPLPMVTLMNRHLEADIIVALLSERANRALKVFANLFMAVFCAPLGWFTLLEAIEGTQDRATEMVARGFMEVWPGYWTLAIAFILMSLQCLVTGLVQLGAMVRGGTDAEGDAS